MRAAEDVISQFSAPATMPAICSHAFLMIGLSHLEPGPK